MEASEKRPLIGISASLLMIEQGCFTGRERAYVGQDYVRAVYQAGGIPLILPILADEQAVQEQVGVIDGLLLSGGYDVHPFLYGEEPDRLLQDFHPERDQFELRLIRHAYESRKPILGVCRGLQLLNVAFGGTLYQDLSYFSAQLLQHSQHAPVYAATHTVDVLNDTLLKKVVETDTLLTNSYHHQSVKKLAPGFRINAVSKDGIVEGIEKTDHPFILGVQWHPELMVEKQTIALKLFRGFVEASRMSVA